MNRRRNQVTSTISPDEVIALHHEFMRLDEDGNGEVSVEEVERLLISMRIKLFWTDNDIRTALKMVDTNIDGIVDIAELNNMLEKYDPDSVIYKALSQHSKIRTEFHRYDADNSGFITKDELVKVVRDRIGISVLEDHIENLMKVRSSTP